MDRISNWVSTREVKVFIKEHIWRAKKPRYLLVINTDTKTRNIESDTTGLILIEKYWGTNLVIN